jgi:hypothetical protein
MEALIAFSVPVFSRFRKTLVSDLLSFLRLSLNGTAGTSLSVMMGVETARLTGAGLLLSGVAGCGLDGFRVSNRGWHVTTIKYSTRRCTAIALSSASSTETFRLSFAGVGVLLVLFPILPDPELCIEAGLDVVD